jgi:hypothetical protein
MELDCTLDISFFVFLKLMEAEFWKYGSLARRQFIQNLRETSGYEHLVVGNLAFLQVLCGFSTDSFTGIY